VRKSQRLHRERDPRVRRSLALAVAAGAVVILTGLAVVGLRVQQVHLAYRLDALRGERAALATLTRELEVQVATLRAPARLEQRARELGLVPPGRDQVRLAREYVAGGAGAAQRTPVVASTDPTVLDARRPQLQ
jgi:cell division protein FtsL